MNKKYVLISTDYSMVINGMKVCAGKIYDSDVYTEHHHTIAINIDRSIVGIPKSLCIFFDTLEQLENYIYLS